MMDPNDETQPSSTAVAREAAAIRDAIDHMADARHKFPERIGPYRIIREIGRGGMGRVLLGVRDDDQFRRQVAIKLLRTTMADDEARRRFEVERQVLSNLTHPNIARLFEGGELEDGTPYLVMEYVEGQSIDDYCDAQRLPLAQRLALFQKVCGAIHFAHTQLVVHRDIKPSNILVTPAGEPKLVDFGIAKLRNPNIVPITVDTTPQLRLMTPEYASPEQVQGQPIGTTSDVYSLGVLLYELVCGRRPYDFKTREHAEIQHVVCDVDPARPSDVVTRPVERRRSDGTTQTVTADEIARRRETRPDTLRRRVRGDLERIILKAMQKVARHRYDSAAKFGEDVQNYLTGMPVVARAPSSWYRCVKFARRNRAGIAAGAVLLLALAGWGVTATIQRATALDLSRRADEARARAEQAWRAAEGERNRAVDAEARASAYFEDSRAALSKFVEELEPQLRRLSGATVARRRLAEVSAAMIERMRASGAMKDVRFKRIAARALVQQGDLRGGVAGGGEGDFTAAVAAYEAAGAYYAELLAEAPQDVALIVEWCVLQRKHAKVLAESRDPARATQILAGALARLASHVANAASQPLGLRARALLLTEQGDIEERAGHFAAARELYESSLKDRKELCAVALDATCQRDLSVGYVDLGNVLISLGLPVEAERALREAVRLRQDLAERADSDDGSARRDLATARDYLQKLLATSGKEREAAELANSAYASIKDLARDDPFDHRLWRDLARLGDRTAATLARLDERAEALARYAEATGAVRAWLTLGNDDEMVRFYQAQCLTGYGDALLTDLSQASGESLASPRPVLREARGLWVKLRASANEKIAGQADKSIDWIDTALASLDKAGYVDR